MNNVHNDISLNSSKKHKKNSKIFVDKIKKLRMDHIMRYRDAIRAFRISELLSIIKEQYPVCSGFLS